jgi:hypothetical protein
MSASRFSRVRATNSRLTADLRGRARLGLHLLSDRLAGALEAARGDAGEHLLEHQPSERSGFGEVPVGRSATSDPPSAVRALGRSTRDAAATERHLPSLVAVAHRGALRVVLALRADDLVELLGHQLGHDAEPDADRQREQPLLRDAGRLTGSRSPSTLLRFISGVVPSRRCSRLVRSCWERTRRLEYTRDRRNTSSGPTRRRRGRWRWRCRPGRPPDLDEAAVGRRRFNLLLR